MKALFLRRYGDPDFLEIREIERPTPSADRVLVKVRAVSINDWDWGLIQATPMIPNRFMAGLLRPRIVVGSDIAGVVEAVGDTVTEFRPGDAVYGDLSGCGFGGFAEYVSPPQGALRPMGSGMSFAQAAAIPQAGMLALQAVIANGQLRPGQSVLVNGGGGGVGSIAIQLLKMQDVTVTGVDSAAKLDAMRAWGFDHVIDYHAEDFTRRGERYDLIIDVRTDRAPADYERALKPDGCYATVGGQLVNLLRIALSRFRPGRDCHRQLRVIALQPNRDLDRFNGWYEAGSFQPVIDSEFDFNEQDVRRAFRHFGASAHKGKIVVAM
ncbi:NAD(P)-dependent alcohol dehydrogenase [Pseudomarimonas salicorniae]|uniref:NAD(P)-dependent alcohol dehydrogenase n=1 Tax=Pseudomarimonas salicorniae TaxID=2933270 RepID=A0ABT0GIB0_9GAMM|nr:NAD(P)-dependent alcohol dehydrogenase [Lysobacter sp. CAU 1642]MCK7594092.1 NAD(P)-dependent alcohol dehydrogenase [Lysobacter sp. CAU 1642]